MPPDDPLPTAEILLAESAWIGALARSLVVDPGTADDVAQDAALVALTNAPARLDSPRSWFRRVVSNLSVSAHRSRSRRDARERAAGAPEETAAADEIVARWEVRRQVVGAVLALDEPYRATILARYFDGLSAPETAARLDVPMETVRTRTRRGLDLLRGRLAHLDDGRGTRGAAVLLLLAGDERARAPVHGPAAGGVAANVLGGALMGAAMKWTIAGAAVGLIALGIAWTSRDVGDDVGDDVGAAPVDAGATHESPVRGTPARTRARPAGTDAATAPGATAGAAADGAAINLDACDRDRDLHGIVVDAAGQPVAGAQVTAIANEAYRRKIIPSIRAMFEEDVVAATKSAADGTFRLRLGAADGAGLRVAAPGFASHESWDRQAGERVRVVLGPELVVTVRVRRETGPGVAGATVHLMGSLREDGTVRRHGETDADGVVRFDAVPHGVQASLLVEPTGVGSAIQLPVKLESGAAQTIDVVVPTGTELTGRVVDAATGLGVRGATIGSQQLHLAPVAAAEDGSFRHPGFAGKIRSLSARAPGYALCVVTVRPGATEVVFSMIPGATAFGRVLDDGGRAVAGASVSLFATAHSESGEQPSLGTCVSGADGAFRVPDLYPAATHLLVARATGRAVAIREVAIAASPGGEFAVGDVVLGAPRTVRVRVVGADGAPAPRQTVALVLGTFESAQGGVGGASETRRTDDLGRATFPGVPRGSFVVQAGRGGPEANVAVGDDDPAPVVLTLSAAAEAAGGSGAPPAAAAGAAPAVVPATGADGEVRVTVVDDAGAPVVGAYVRVDFEKGAPAGGTTGADGSVRVACPGAPIRVLAMGTGPWIADPDGMRVAPGARDVRVVVPRGAALRGRVLDEQGRPAKDVWVQAFSAGGAAASVAVAEDGRFELSVPDGEPLDLQVVHAGGQDGGAARGVAWRRGVRAGPDDVELRLAVPQSPSSLIVRVVDPDGAPIAGTQVMVLSLGASRSVNGTTDAEGRATLRNLPAAPCGATLSPFDTSPALRTFAAPRYARAVPGEDGEVVLRAFVAAHVRGRVVVEDGSPAAGVILMARADGGNWSALSGPDGEFDLLVPKVHGPHWILEAQDARATRGVTRVGTASVEAPADGVVVRLATSK